jgi:hypothetical protein
MQQNDVAAYRELLGRIVASPQFAPADSLRRMLQYLFDRSQNPADGPPKEHEIAVRTLHRRASFDPKIDPIVRVNMAAIRSRLRAYFEGPGRNEALRLRIPKGQYVLSFQESGSVNGAAEPPAGTLEALSRFWKPYLSAHASNILIYSELLFFRDDRGNYVRSIYVNDRSKGVAEMKERFPEVPVSGLRPSFHFVSAGEMRAVLDIEGAFRDMGAPLKVRDSRFFSWADAQKSNLIALGGSRTNVFLDSLQGRDCFVISADSIENRDVQLPEEHYYRGQQFTDGKLERLVEYAVVTRRPGVVGRSSVTLIGANHGRAIQAAGNALACEDKVSSILEAMGYRQPAVLPAHFQILLRTDMIDYDEEVVSVEYVAHRVFNDESCPQSVAT